MIYHFRQRVKWFLKKFGARNHVLHLEITAGAVRPDAPAHRRAAGEGRACPSTNFRKSRGSASRASRRTSACCRIPGWCNRGATASGRFTSSNPQANGGTGEFIQLAIRGAKELPEHGERPDQSQDASSPAAANRRRFISTRSPGRFDRVYGPGRSWQAFGHLLLRILPPLVVADLGAGEGLLSELLARRCKKVIAVDNSEKIVAFGAAKAKKNDLKNLEFRQGDLQNPPIEAEQRGPRDFEPGVASRRRIRREAHCRRAQNSEAARADYDSRSAQAQLRARRTNFTATAGSVLPKAICTLARRRRFQEDRNQRRRARGTAAAFPDHSGQRSKISDYGGVTAHTTRAS